MLKRTILLSILLSLFAVLTAARGLAADLKTGIVTRNAFLLSHEPNVKRENGYVYGLVGYLPVGTRVYTDGYPVVVFNLTDGQPEEYVAVHSSIGIGGLLHTKHLKLVENNPIAVVVSSSQIAIHNPDSRKGRFKRLLRMGKYDRAYLEITGDADADFYTAILHRRVTGGGLPEQEPVRLWKELERQNKVVVVSKASFDANNLPTPAWTAQTGVANDLVDRMVETVKDKLGDEAVDEARAFLADANSLQCLLKASANASLGFKIFGSGLSFKLDLALKDQDHMLRMVMRELVSPDGSKSYLFLQSVKCEGATPVRLQRLTLQEGLVTADKRVSIHLKDWSSENTSKWITSLSGRDVPFRMIRVRDEASYFAALRQLDGFVTGGGDSFLAALSGEQKEVVLNLLLREIAHFEHRRDIIRASTG